MGIYHLTAGAEKKPSVISELLRAILPEKLVLQVKYVVALFLKQKTTRADAVSAQTHNATAVPVSPVETALSPPDRIHITPDNIEEEANKLKQRILLMSANGERNEYTTSFGSKISSKNSTGNKNKDPRKKLGVLIFLLAVFALGAIVYFFRSWIVSHAVLLGLSIGTVTLLGYGILQSPWSGRVSFFRRNGAISFLLGIVSLCIMALYLYGSKIATSFATLSASSIAVPPWWVLVLFTAGVLDCLFGRTIFAKGIGVAAVVFSFAHGFLWTNERSVDHPRPSIDTVTQKLRTENDALKNTIARKDEEILKLQERSVPPEDTRVQTDTALEKTKDSLQNLVLKQNKEIEKLKSKSSKGQMEVKKRTEQKQKKDIRFVATHGDKPNKKVTVIADHSVSQTLKRAHKKVPANRTVRYKKIKKNFKNCDVEYY